MLRRSRLGVGWPKSDASDLAARWLGGAPRRRVIALGHYQERIRSTYNKDQAPRSRGELGSSAGRGRGRRGGGAGRSPAGVGCGGNSGVGESRNGGGGGDPDDPSAYSDLHSLAAAVKQRAPGWLAARRINKLRSAFNVVAKRDGDPALLRDVMRHLAGAYLPLVPGLQRPFDCVLPLWAGAKAGYWGDGLAEALAARLAQDGGELLRRANGQDHSQLWWSLSEAPFEARQRLPVAELLRLSEERLLRMGPSELKYSQICSNVLLAAARLQQGSEGLLHHLAACLCALLSEAKEQALANSLYSLGKLEEECGHKPRQQDLQRLAGEVAARLASARQPEDSAAASARSFIPQELSNMLWGCAKLGYADSALLQPLAAAAGQAAGRMNVQELANSLYALAVLGCSGKEYAAHLQVLMTATVERLRQRPSEFLPQDLSNILWALALLQAPGSEGLVAAASGECLRRSFEDFNAQSISNAAWALAKLGRSEQQGWYAAAVEAAMQPGFNDTATGQAQSNLLYALALVRHRPPAALLAGMAASQQLRSQANPQECANTLWALAILYGSGMDRGEDAGAVLVDVLAGRLGQLLLQPAGEEPNEHDLANSMWALAVMGPAALSRHSSLVEGLLREVERRREAGRGSSFTFEAVAQLWQAQLEMAHAGNVSGALSGFANARLQNATAQFRLQQHDSSTSKFQRRVLSALTRLQRRQQAAGSSPAIRSVEVECWVPDLHCWADIVVELEGGRRVAVEVDGPIHFLANQPYTRVKDGPTQLRDRQLARVFGRGNVMSVPYWEWRELKGEAEQEEYLCSLLTGSAPVASEPASVASKPERPASGGSKRQRQAEAPDGCGPAPETEPWQAASGVGRRPKAQARGAAVLPADTEPQTAAPDNARPTRKAAPATSPVPPLAPEPQQAGSGAQQQPREEPATGTVLLAPKPARRVPKRAAPAAAEGTRGATEGTQQA